MGYFKNAAERDGLLLGLVGLIAYGIAYYFDAFDFLVEFLKKHEDWQADEFIPAVLTAGLMGFIYAWRRLVELKKETRNRNLAEGRVVWLAYHDPLTKLPNRHFLEARLADGNWGLKYAGSMIAIDLDGFKKVNDLVGHHGGDELLVVISQRLRKACQQETIIRLGGDEFLLVTPSTGVDAQELCKRIQQELSAPIIISGIQVEVGGSIGIAAIALTGSLEETMLHADLAMYTAKRQGRNSICAYDPHLWSAKAERVAIEIELRKAISERRIVTHYQPIINMQSGAVLGFEALARWTLADGTPIPPATFIGIAEEAGLITELSDQLLLQACKDAKTWPTEMFLAYNLSATQLTDRLLGLRIIKIMSVTGLPARRLELEVTESAVMSDLGSARAVIEDLKAVGIRIAIDDFGIGFSSLSQLSNLPFDKIKIDRSFVNTFEANDKQAKIVRSIVGLGRGLGVQTTAEGIELESQYEHLKELGCEQGQGYLFSKAMPADAVLGFLSAATEKAMIDPGQ